MMVAQPGAEPAFLLLLSAAQTTNPGLLCPQLATVLSVFISCMCVRKGGGCMINPENDRRNRRRYFFLFAAKRQKALNLHLNYNNCLVLFTEQFCKC